MAARGGFGFPPGAASRRGLDAALVLAVAMTVDKAINYGAAEKFEF